MTITPDQLTKLPVCPVCRREQLTNEELVREPDPNKRRCWFCLVDSLISLGIENGIPDPELYGRPNINKDYVILASKQKIFRASPNIGDVINEAIASSPSTPTPTPTQQTPVTPSSNQKPILTMPGVSPLKFDDTQRTEFAKKFGIDPVPKNQPYEIIAHGASEDTYMKFVCPIPIELAEQREIQRIMGGMVEIFGKLLKYGPQFAGTLIDLQAMTPEMFLGGRR